MVPKQVAGRLPRAVVPLGAWTRPEVILGHRDSVTDDTEVREGDEQLWVIRTDEANLAQVPSGAETAQQTFDRLLRTGVAPVLRGLGLKGSGRHFHLDRGQLNLGWVSFQGGKYNSRVVVDFTINLTVARTLSGLQHWRKRIGSFFPDVEDTWWRVPAGADTDDLLADLVDSISDHGLVALVAAMDEVEHPPDPPRPLRRPLPSVGHLFQLYVPASLEVAFTDVTSADASIRGLALRALYQYARTDARLVPILTSAIRDDASPFIRAAATTMLGFVPCDATVSLSVFHRVLDQDEDLNVRIAARHAIRTVERRYEGG